MKNNFISALNTHIFTLIPQTPPPRLLLGLSGGPDSVFLFHTLLPLHQEKKISLECAHLNHGWRTEAVHDEQFCQKLCTKHDITLHIGYGKDLLQQLPQHKMLVRSREAQGRHVRRLFFESVILTSEVRSATSTPYIVLAHHQQDQQETFFIRLLRGTSLTGLAGMKPIDGRYVRPLLQTNKHDILTWLKTHNVQFCKDESNESSAFLRNRIRHTVIPALQKCDARFASTFQHTLNALREEQELLETLTQKTEEKLLDTDGRSNLTHFRLLHHALQKRILIRMLIKHEVLFTPSTGFLNELKRFLLHPRGGEHVISPRHSLHKQGKQFWIQHTI